VRELNGKKPLTRPNSKWKVFYSILTISIFRGWLRCCATNRKVAGSIPAGVNGFFIDTISFRPNYGPGDDSVSDGIEYREYFLGVKSGRCVRLTNLPPSCATVTKSGSPNFLEPSGPVQACNGTALSFTIFRGTGCLSGA
jgi:hypothetical protein